MLTLDDQAPGTTPIPPSIEKAVDGLSTDAEITPEHKAALFREFTLDRIERLTRQAVSLEEAKIAQATIVAQTDKMQAERTLAPDVLEAYRKREKMAEDELALRQRLIDRAGFSYYRDVHST